MVCVPFRVMRGQAARTRVPFGLRTPGWPTGGEQREEGAARERAEADISASRRWKRAESTNRDTVRPKLWSGAGMVHQEQDEQKEGRKTEWD